MLSGPLMLPAREHLRAAALSNPLFLVHGSAPPEPCLSLSSDLSLALAARALWVAGRTREALAL